MPDHLDKVAEAGHSEAGEHAALEDDQIPSMVKRYTLGTWQCRWCPRVIAALGFGLCLRPEPVQGCGSRQLDQWRRPAASAVFGLILIGLATAIQATSARGVFVKLQAYPYGIPLIAQSALGIPGCGMFAVAGDLGLAKQTNRGLSATAA